MPMVREYLKVSEAKPVVENYVWDIYFHDVQAPISTVLDENDAVGTLYFIFMQCDGFSTRCVDS